MIEPKFWQDDIANNTTKWQPGLSTTILLLLTGIALLTSLLSAFINQDASETWWSGFLQNFSTEMMGAIITFGLFELILNRRKEIDEKTSLETRQKRRLKILVGSRSNLVALQALDELRSEGWLDLLHDRDISLKSANWQGAYLQNLSLENKNLRRINLSNASLFRTTLANCDVSVANCKNTQLGFSNLENVELRYSDMRNIHLNGSSIENSDIREVNLTSANLGTLTMKDTNFRGAVATDANLQGASFENVDLRGSYLNRVNMRHTKLQKTDLRSAYLTGAELKNANFDVDTILPDGTNYVPDEGLEQMERFTNPAHPEFWQPEWAKEWERTGNPPEWLAAWYRDTEL